jgi:hypothetical protein
VPSAFPLIVVVDRADSLTHPPPLDSQTGGRSRLRRSSSSVRGGTRSSRAIRATSRQKADCRRRAPTNGASTSPVPSPWPSCSSELTTPHPSFRQSCALSTLPTRPHVHSISPFVTPACKLGAYPFSSIHHPSTPLPSHPLCRRASPNRATRWPRAPLGATPSFALPPLFHLCFACAPPPCPVRSRSSHHLRPLLLAPLDTKRPTHRTGVLPVSPPPTCEPCEGVRRSS